MPLTSGQVLHNRYRLEALLGQGGFGAVYRAWDLRLSHPCAVKENLDTTPEAQQQFRQEALILAHLNHPNLPRVTDHFIDAEGRQYLVMDFVEGDDLETMLEEQGPLDESRVLSWLGQILDALEYMHSRPQPVIHRDIKPANIKITPQGKAILVDFGLAKRFVSGQTTITGAKAVSPGFAPVEQYIGRTDARSDIYALGATLYCLLTGEAPPESPERAAGTHLTSPRRLNPTISAHTERVILKAMTINTERRYQTVDKMRLAFFAPLPLPPAPSPPTLRPAARPRIWLRSTTTSRPVFRPKLRLGLGRLVLVVVLVVIVRLLIMKSMSRVSTPARSAATPTPYSPLFSDDFSDKSGGWSEISDEEVAKWYEGGEYHVLVKKEGNWSFRSLLDDEYADFVLEVDARAVEGPDGEYGVIFRQADKDKFYIFKLRMNGRYSISKYLGNKWIILKSWDTSPYIKEANDTNHLKIVADGGKFTVYVNGRGITSVLDDSFSQGKVGVFAATIEAPNVHVAFDNFKVWALKR